MSVLEPEEQAADRGEERSRRLWSAEEERRILAETFAPGASVSIMAGRHDLNTNMLFTWRRRAGAAASSAPAGTVTFVLATISADPAPATSPPTAPAGHMEIARAGGERVIIGPNVSSVKNPATL